MQRPRTPGWMYAAVSVALLVMLTTLALTARQPPPPTIAEFAPQAVENISDAPTDQSSSSGRAGGAGIGEGGSAPDPTPSAAAPINVPRVRKCVGDPPRQIEDPQSPPCVPFWSGDNGGATHKGVTRDTITIAFPNDNRNNGVKKIGALATFFNKRFEFYGRKIVLAPFKDAGNHADNPDVATMRSHAVLADEQLRSFASLSYTDSGGGESVYYDELARRQILSVGVEGSPREGDAGVNKSAPYAWRVLPGLDTVEQHFGEWLCKQVAARPARQAGGEQAELSAGVAHHQFRD